VQEMASITIRNLPDQAKENLRVLAAMQSMSLEAYTRKILEQESKNYSQKTQNIADMALELFGPKHGIELNLPDRNSLRQPPTFENK